MSRARSEAQAPPGARVLPRRFYEGDATEVAKALLNKLVVGRGRVGRIVEVEAYRGGEDPASHAFRGLTRRNATMFGRGGLLYVYFSYGMHVCANVVCGTEGVAQAVLLRALAPVSGIELMREARIPGATDRQLASGPGKLCQAMSISRGDDGADLTTGDRGIVLADDGITPPPRPEVSGRVGLSVAADEPWRWWVPGDPNVSSARTRRPLAGRAQGAGQSGSGRSGTGRSDGSRQAGHHSVSPGGAGARRRRQRTT